MRNGQEIKSLAGAWETSAPPYGYFLYNIGNTTFLCFLVCFFQILAIRSICVMAIAFSKAKGVRRDLNLTQEHLAPYAVHRLSLFMVSHALWQY